MKYEYSGDTWFVDLTKGWNQGHFTKDVPVAMGKDLPLNRASMGKNLDKVKNWEEASPFIYPVVGDQHG